MWQLVKKLFSEALEVAPEHRAAFLKEACGGDDALLAEVASLLEADEGSETLPNAINARQVGVLPGDTAHKPVEEMRIGAWELIEEIGRGGMGVVFLAEREEDGFEQRAAIKLLRFGLGTDDLVDHFRTERRVLASLEHPNIARLIDGGVTGDGQPWFAMEYVEGVPITEYCDAKGLTVDERLEIFLKVCRAVQHAHNRLIIHRDLKPSNILVPDNGDPKLLDFGLAKILEDPTGDPSTTRPGRRWMTLEYASPEQVKGDPVGTPSDTYQLGLILYEMLTGRRAYSLKGLSPTEAERIITEVDPPRPSVSIFSSDAVASHSLPPTRSGGRATLHGDRQRRRLRGDLDTIVMKALQKDPARGYVSAEAMSTDVERHLKGLTIFARPDTFSYRTKTFVRRHRWGVTAVAAVAVSLIGGFGVAIWQAGVARSGWEMARAENQKSEQVTSFLMGLFEAAEPGAAQGDTITARELLDRGIRQAETLDNQPELQATLFGVTGRVYHSLGNLAKAESLYRRSIFSWATLDPDPNRDEAYLRTVVDYSGLLTLVGRHEEAVPHLGRVMKDIVPGRADEALRRDALFELYASHHAMGNAEAAGEAFAAWEAAIAAAPGAAEAAAAKRMVTLGETQVYRGQIRGDSVAFRRGQDFIRAAVASMRASYGAEHPSTGSALNTLVNALLVDVSTFQPDEPSVLAAADSLSREALELHRVLYDDPHIELHRSLMNRALVLRYTKQYDEAETAVREALAVAQALAGAGSPSWAWSRRELGYIDLARGNFDEAIPVLREMRARSARVHGPDDLFTCQSDFTLSEALAGAGRFEEAAARLNQAYGTLEATRGRGDFYTQRALGRLVALYEAWGKPNEAATYRSRLNAPSQTPSPDRPGR